MTQGMPFLPGLSPVCGKELVARLDGGRLSSDGGVVAAPKSGLGRSLGFGDWPKADCRAWHQTVRAGDSFTTAGGGAHWRPATRDGYQAAYGRWLAFLARRGWLDPGTAPAGRLKREWVATYVTELQARIEPISVWSYLSDLHNAVFRMIPEANWSWLRDIVNRLHRHMPSISVTTSDLLPIWEIYDMGIEVMEATERAPPARPLYDSVHYRDGLMWPWPPAACSEAATWPASASARASS